VKGELSFVGLPILEAHKACPHIKGYTAAAASLCITHAENSTQLGV
jgi:hypothetical protein